MLSMNVPEKVTIWPADSRDACWYVLDPFSIIELFFHVGQR